MGNAQLAVGLLQHSHRVTGFAIEHGWPVFTQELDPAASHRHLECCREIDRLAASISERLAERPNRAVARGEVEDVIRDAIESVTSQMFGAEGQPAYPLGLETALRLTVTNSVLDLLTALTTPTETTDPAMEGDDAE